MNDVMDRAEAEAIDAEDGARTGKARGGKGGAGKAKAARRAARADKAAGKVGGKAGGKGAKAAVAPKAKGKAKAANAANFLEPEVRQTVRRVAKEQGMEVNHLLQKAVETWLIDNQEIEAGLRARLSAKREVLDTAVALARSIDADGGFDAHLILTVIRRITTDDGTAPVYAAAIGDAGEGEAPRRASLNQQLGRVIKAAVGAKTKRNEDGRIARVQVTGEAITSYSLLEKAA